MPHVGMHACADADMHICGMRALMCDRRPRAKTRLASGHMSSFDRSLAAAAAAAAAARPHRAPNMQNWRQVVPHQKKIKFFSVLGVFKISTFFGRVLTVFGRFGRRRMERVIRVITLITLFSSNTASIADADSSQ